MISLDASKDREKDPTIPVFQHFVRKMDVGLAVARSIVPAPGRARVEKARSDRGPEAEGLWASSLSAFNTEVDRLPAPSTIAKARFRRLSSQAKC